METKRLSDGTVILQTTICILVTEYDLVAVACFALHRRKSIRNRKQLTTMLDKLIENRGLNGIITCMKKFSESHGREAQRAVRRLFPELKPSATKLTDVRASMN